MARNSVRALQNGERPAQPTDGFDGVIPTYAGDTVLRTPCRRIATTA